MDSYRSGFDGLGFVVARFGLFSRRSESTRGGSAVQPYGLSLWFGTALIAAGIAVTLLSAWRHTRLVGELKAWLIRKTNRSSGQVVFLALFLAFCWYGNGHPSTLSSQSLGL